MQYKDRIGVVYQLNDEFDRRMTIVLSLAIAVKSVILGGLLYWSWFY